MLKKTENNRSLWHATQKEETSMRQETHRRMRTHRGLSKGQLYIVYFPEHAEDPYVINDDGKKRHIRKSQLTNRLYWTPAAGVITETNEKEPEMGTLNTRCNIEKTTLVNGVRVADTSPETLIDMISSQNKCIQDLEEIPTSSRYIQQQIAKHRENIRILTEVLDEKAEEDAPDA
jgi:hypothetical protein